MNLTFSSEWQCFLVSDELREILQKAIDQINHTGKAPFIAITFNFRDPSYTAETGGYHPTEIRIINSDNGWYFDYITDFSYQGLGYMAELVKEIDFLFQEQLAYHLYTGEHQASEAASLFKLWQGNFVSYESNGVFEVTVTPH